MFQYMQYNYMCVFGGGGWVTMCFSMYSIIVYVCRGGGRGGEGG